MLRLYDDKDRLISEAVLDVDRQLKADPDRPAVVTWQYDGQVQYAHFYDTAGEEIAEDGCMTERSILDQRTGEAIEIACLDAQGHPLRSNSGWAFQRKKFDGHGREIETAWYREDGRHLASSPDYAIRRKQYDDRGNMTEEAYFGEDEKLRLVSDGYAITRRKYDDHDNISEEAYFGEDETLRLGPSGYAVVRKTHDDHGKITEEAHFGEDEKLRLGPDGWAILRARYDDHGNLTEIALFGADEKVRLAPKLGYAIVRLSYDDHGNIIEKAFFGEDNKLRLGPDGYAVVRKKYDDRGKVTEESYFGEDEKLRFHPKFGYAFARYKYDGHGNMVEEEDFEENELLEQRLEYDDRGKKTERAYFGSDGALADVGGGYQAIARTEIIVHDGKGVLTARCANDEMDDFWKLPRLCADGNGRPLISHPVILRIFPGTRAQGLGLQNGDIIEAYDSKPVFTVGDLIELTGHSGDGVRRIDVIRTGRRLVFQAPAGRLGIRIGIAFVPAGSASPAKHAGQ